VGAPRKTPEQQEAAWTAAYELKCAGKSLGDIAAELAGAPHWCGGKTTARGWVENGLALAAAKGDPLRKQRARREMSIDAIDMLRVEMAQDVVAGHLPDRAAYYRLQLEAIRLSTHLAGAKAPAALPRVKRTDGSSGPATPGELLDALAAMQPELDALIDDMQSLPDDEKRP
jgi:hypothetical protein